MKKAAVPYVVVLALTLVITSCKNKNNQSTTSTAGTVTETTVVATDPEYLYVTAPSGLTLREHNNLQSEKLAVMLYGSKVKILTTEKDTTMNVGGIEGGMHQVEYNQKTGYAFNGFLSKFFPPEEDITAKNYVEELKQQFPEASYTESTGGSASNPTTTYTVLLPTTAWHEAFYIAQQLFDVPNTFAFPNPKGSNAETVKEGNVKKRTFLSELQITRNNNTLQKIQYRYSAEGFGSSVTITKEGNRMKIEKTEVLD